MDAHLLYRVWVHVIMSNHRYYWVFAYIEGDPSIEMIRCNSRFAAELTLTHVEREGRLGRISNEPATESFARREAEAWLGRTVAGATVTSVRLE